MRSCAAILLLLAAAGHFPLEAGSFIFTQDMGISRADYAATILPNGKVLLAGGSSEGPVTLQSTQLYDPVAGTFSATGSLNTPRNYHTATLLRNGKVLIAGGYGYSQELASAELYDPVAGTFTPSTGTMPVAMAGHTATLLQNGQVLLAGGMPSGSNSAQLYDPTTDSFSLTGSMASGREFFTATLLPNGKVLVAGGWNVGTELASCELYDPNDGTFSPAGNMTTARSSHSAVLLSTGNVLLAGGEFSRVYLASAELYNPVLETFSPTQSMATARSGHTATLLPDNTVLIASGDASCGYACVTPTAEIFDPPSNSFTSTGSLNVARDRMTATLLPTGAVLIAGGADTENFLSSAELYVGSPPPPVVLIVPGIFGTKLASNSGVVWLSNETIYDTAPPLNLPDLYQLEYDSSGQPTTPLSVQAIKDGTDYGGLFNLASDKGYLQYELECTLPIRTILAIDGQICDRDFNVYNGLITTLTSNGFTYDVFPYDWRGDIAQIADQLNQKVNSLTSQYPGRSISLVAHSMGGLVVGEMFAKYGVSPLISHVIALGSPFLGSVESYFEFEAWRSFYQQLTPQQSQEIGANWTAAYELLPQWKFIHLQNGVMPPVFSVYNGTYSSLFPALPRSQGPNSALALASIVWKAEKTVTPIPQAYAIIGSGISTLTVLTNNLSNGACLQGVYGDGDNTVPINSALGGSWVPAQNVGYVKAKHAELPENGNAINAIIQILDGNSPTTLSKTPLGVRPSATGCCPGPTCQPPGKN
jgi:hypothetical protein